MAAALPPHLPPKLSATGRSVLHARREPGRAIAGAFAIVVHIGFFALIIFGVSWQVKMPSPISAELWSTLPPSVNRVAEPPPAPQEEPAAPPEPKVAEQKVAEPNKADIALKAKKEREEKLKREKEEKLAAELKKRDEQKRTEDKRKAEEDKQRKADDAKR
ncbi:MAG: hypothetical protein ING60_07565, partial [Rhodocyclaceae bacterium]|nr:hypothetical protein [Rhodocyclaceae bacterium]